MEASSLVAIPGSRLPEMMGNFHLDNHHVEEWSDPSSEPGHKHRARKEVGKWVNLEQNADIHYQKQEDSKHSDRSQERSRTEVIQGKAPDSTFQVVRSHRQYQDGDEKSGSSMQQTSSTSYHVSSSRGVRSTTKTTSNKTTTKTVTVSGGGRADDFETLRMSFTPLDTSTQRERISVSRSGTMGVRRPPTRRHTPAALLCSSPEDGPEAQRPDEGQILVDSDDNLRDTPDPDVGKMGDPSGMSIVGFKNISPKIRVGFPVEIQLELQNKLRSSSTLEREVHHHHHHHHHHDELERETTDLDFTHVNKETESNGTGLLDTVLPIPLGGISSVNSSSRDSTFDFPQKKKSASTLLLGSNFESSLGNKESQNGTLYGNSFRSSLHEFSSRIRDEEAQNGIGNPRRMSWDLLQNIHQIRQQRNEQNSKLYSTLSSGTSSGGEDYVPSLRGNHVDEVDDDDEYSRNRRNSFTQRLRSINNGNNESESKKSVINLSSSREHLINFTRQSSYEAQNESVEKSGIKIEEIIESNDIDEDHHYQHSNNHHHQEDREENHIMSTPDVLHHDISNSNSLSPSLERSRKLLKMLDETPDLINKMSFRSYFSTGVSEKPESKDWEENHEKDDQMDWETQRQLSFLNDSLSRILDETRNIESITFKADSKAKSETYLNGHSEEPDGLDVNGNLKELGKIIQVSQTWISSIDHKAAQTARDNDVVTSISATNDAYKKGPKKVEFCKTEVHFTPDSGRFNIVETDENKPSTAHLFRRKKRNERKSQQQQQLQQQQPQQQPSFSSSSSMSSLESTTATTTDKCETAYIVEMEVNSSTEKHREHKIDTSMQTSKVQKSEENKSTVQIEDVSSSINQESNSLPTLASSTIGAGSKNDGRGSRVFINLDSIASDNSINNEEEYEDDIRSPSHMILSNYGEMKIQRYLKQLKTPSSREGSSSPLGSPTPQHHHDDANDEDGHFRFDNILYENGSFVPLATRRSLIEMNNRNRKRLNAAASQSSDNSSTTSTYSLPTSEHHDQYGTLRMGSMEAVVSTSGGRPQITSVDFSYKNDSGMNGHTPSDDYAEKMTSDVEYHNLSVKERRERFSSVPSPMMPQHYGTTKSTKNTLRHSTVISPTDSQASDISSRPSSVAYHVKKPPTPILPTQFANFEKTGAELRERFYAKANGNGNISSISEASSNETTKTGSTTIKKGEGKSKSIVTIGSYNESGSHDHVNESNSREMTVRTTTTMDDVSEKESHSLEPVLSLDHTWKGPAHYEGHTEQETTSQSKMAAARSLTFPKSLRPEPEWVSKAKSRETRVTDWSLIEKQQTSTTNRNTEPPWISEIRFRNKPLPSEELKAIPKISVVYPWQRDNSSKESSVERQDASEESHIVSIVPEPKLNSSPKTREREDNKKFGSYDLYSGKSLPSIKSLKSVPEVSVPASRKNKSIVKVHSEPEHYISNPQKYYVQGRKKDAAGMEGYDLATTTVSKSSSSSKKASSMRVTTETGSTAVSLNDSKREAETFPKKSRKPLQVTQQNKERTVRGGEEGRKHEEKYRTQPKPPKPPQRVTSLTREEGNGRDREGTMMTVSPFRESSRPTQQKERASDTSVASHTTTSRKTTTSRRKAAEATHESSESSSQQQQQPRDFSSHNHHQPVVHRHPVIQINKLPMRTAKVSVTDGKRVSTSSSNKPKSNKHHATAAPVKAENTKPKENTSAAAGATTTSSRGVVTTSSSRDKPGRSSHSAVNKFAETNSGTQLRGKPRRSGQQTPLKTSTRSPSLELETKKRRTNVGEQDSSTKGDGKRK